MATEIGKLIAVFEADPTPFMRSRKQVEAAQRQSAATIDKIEKELTRQTIAEIRKREAETKRAATQSAKEVAQAAKRAAKEQEQAAKQSAREQTNAARQSAREQARIERELARASASLQKQRSNAIIAEHKRVEREVAASARRIAQQQAGAQQARTAFIGRAAGIGTALVGISVISELRNAARAVFEFNANLENTKIAFSTMMGSSDQALRHLKELQQFALSTPFGFQDLVEASQRMQALGFEAKEVVPVLNDVGNAVAAAGGGKERLDRVVLALSQMQSKGRVMTQELNQLAEAGIPAWKIMEVQLGKTRAELVDLVEDGKISSKVFLDAFRSFSRANFGDLMQQQSRTFSGALSNIKDALLQTASTAFEPLYKEISSIAVRISDEMTKGKVTFERALTALVSGAGEIMGRAGVSAGKAFVSAMADEIAQGKFLDFDLMARRYMPLARGLGIALGQALRSGMESVASRLTTTSGPSTSQQFIIDPVTGRRIYAGRDPYGDAGEFAIAGGAGQRSVGAGPTGIPRIPLFGAGGGKGGGGGGEGVR